MTAQRILNLKLPVRLLSPLPHVLELDSAQYNIQVTPVRATDAGYSAEGRHMRLEGLKPEKGHREKLASVHIVRFNGMSLDIMKVCSDLVLHAQDFETKVHQDEYTRWAKRWTYRMIGGGDSSWFYLHITGNVMKNDLRAHLHNLRVVQVQATRDGQPRLAERILGSFEDHKRRWTDAKNDELNGITTQINNAEKKTRETALMLERNAEH